MYIGGELVSWFTPFASCGILFQMNTTLLFLGIVALLQLAIFLLVMRRGQCPQVGITEAMQRKACSKIHALRDKLTSIQWTTNALLNSEYGKTNIAQKEFLYGMSKQCTEAHQELESALTDLRWIVTSGTLGEPEKLVP